MAENNTFNFDLDAPATPTLTLDPIADEAAEAAKLETPKAEPVKVEDTPLSPEEQKMVNDFAEKIDITNSQMVLQYGAASLIRIASAVVGADDADLQAAQTALDNWNKAADRKDANEQYTLNRQLYTAVDTLYTAAADEADSKAKGQLTDLYDSFVSSQMILDRETAAYNQEADSYLKLASGFPGGVQAALWGVKDIPTFEP